MVVENVRQLYHVKQLIPTSDYNGFANLFNDLDCNFITYPFFTSISKQASLVSSLFSLMKILMPGDSGPCFRQFAESPGTNLTRHC